MFASGMLSGAQAGLAPTQDNAPPFFSQTLLLFPAAHLWGVGRMGKFYGACNDLSKTMEGVLIFQRCISSKGIEKCNHFHLSIHDPH